MGSAAFVATVLFFFVPATAAAVCTRQPPLKVWPHHGGLAPTNAQIVIEGKVGPLRLVTAPRARPRAVLSLTPAPGGVRKPPSLEPDTSYELRDDADRVVGVFTTGSLADTAPPTWPGVTKAVTPKPPAKSADEGGPLECSAPTLRLEGEMAATDDLTARTDIRYALWLGETLDYDQPPVTWTTVPDNWREATSFTLTYGLELPKERPLKLGVRAIDLAGNASPPSELTLK